MRSKLIKVVKRLCFSGGLRARRIWAGPAKGLSLYLDPTNASQRILGTYEREIGYTLKRFVSKAATFIDIGAGDGYYTLVAAVTNPSIVVVGCEPQPSMATRFEENLDLNEVGDRHRVTWMPNSVGTQHARLDDFGKDLPGPMVLKVDVDGAEIDVLESGVRVLSRSVVSLILEVHSQELGDRALELLGRLGFQCRIIHNAWWRKILPDHRSLALNRWLIAEK